MRHRTTDAAQTAGLQGKGRRAAEPPSCPSASRENPSRSHWDGAVGARPKVCTGEPRAEEQAGVLPAEPGARRGQEISGGGGEGGEGSDALSSQRAETRRLQKHIRPRMRILKRFANR